MKKRVLSVLLAALMLLTLFPVVGAVEEVEAIEVTAERVELRSVQTWPFNGRTQVVSTARRFRVETTLSNLVLVVRLSCGASSNNGANQALQTGWANSRVPGNLITITGYANTPGAAPRNGTLRAEW